MALTFTQRIDSASADTFGTGAYTSASFTPTANSYVYVIGWWMNESADSGEGTSLTVADSLTSGFTNITATTSSPGWGYGISAWRTTNDVGGSPSARTVSLDCGANNVHAYRLYVFDISGTPDTTNPTAGPIIGTDADGNNAFNMTLSATPTADDLIVAAVAVGVNSGTIDVGAGTGWSELVDADSTGWAAWQLQALTGVTSASVDWTDLNTNTGTSLGATALAFIIKNSAGGGGGDSPILMGQACL